MHPTAPAPRRPLYASIFWLIALLIALPSLNGCDLMMDDGEGGEMCVDDFLRKSGSSIEQLEREAARQGIEGSALLKKIYDASLGIADFLVDCSASEGLRALANATDGPYFRVSNAKEGMDRLITYTDRLQGESVDIAFLVDATGSMSNSISTVKNRLAEIIEGLKGKDVRVSVAFFRDRNADINTWYMRNPSGLTSASNPEVQDFLAQGEANGKGNSDIPESLYDGLFETISELPWQAKERIIVAITDAGPLTGDKTVHDLADVSALAQLNKVRVAMIQVALFQ